MAHSVEARVPLLDHPLVELCWQMPERLKVKGFNEKYIMRQAFRKELPETIRTRKKWPMTLPFQEWLAVDRSDLVEHYLSSGTVEKFSIFDPELVRSLLKQQRGSNPIYGQTLMYVLSMHVWIDLFINKQSVGQLE